MAWKTGHVNQWELSLLGRGPVRAKALGFMCLGHMCLELQRHLWAHQPQHNSLTTRNLSEQIWKSDPPCKNYIQNFCPQMYKYRHFKDWSVQATLFPESKCVCVFPLPVQPCTVYPQRTFSHHFVHMSWFFTYLAQCTAVNPSPSSNSISLPCQAWPAELFEPQFPPYLWQRNDTSLSCLLVFLNTLPLSVWAFCSILRTGVESSQGTAQWSTVAWALGKTRDMAISLQWTALGKVAV